MMDLKDKETIKKIIFILFIGALFLWCAINHTLALTLILNVLSLFIPFLVGASMAFIFNVILKLFENYIFVHITEKADPAKRIGKIWHSSVRILSLILTLIVIFGIVILIIALVIPELKHSIQLIAKEFPAYLNYTQKWIEDTLVKLGLDSVAANIPVVNWTELLKSIGEFMSGEGPDVLSSVTEFTTGVFSAVTNAVIGFVFAIYILLQKEKLSRQLKGLIYAVFSEKNANTIFGVGRLSNEIFGKFITGQFVEAIIIGTLCYLGMVLLSLTTVFEFPYALMISVTVGFTALIPVVGAFIGTAVGALLIVMQDPIQALWFILFIIVLQQIESNLIYPRVVGKSIGLPGIWVLFAVVAGGTIYGIPGVIIGVPLCSVIYCLMKNWVTAKLDNKKIDIDAVEARNLKNVSSFGIKEDK